MSLSHGPLSGLTVGRVGRDTSCEVAAWLLAGLGATVVEASPAESSFAAVGAAPATEDDLKRVDVTLGPRPGGPLAAEPAAEPAAGQPATEWPGAVQPAPTGPGAAQPDPFNSGAAQPAPTGPDPAQPGADQPAPNETRRAQALLLRSPVSLQAPGVPDGTVEYTAGLALAAAALAAWRTDSVVAVSELGVALQIFLPLVMAAAYGSPPPVDPTGPIEAPGGGWLSVDLGAPGDPERFADLLGVVGPGANAAAVSTAAQEWRLPVCEYLQRESPPPEVPVLVLDDSPIAVMAGDGPSPPAGTPLAGVEICDLTAMWAGPLATWLLGGLGAKVYKVEPAARLDGTRAIDGRGIYPGGQQRQPGEDSAIFNALNRGKNRVPLDLRDRVQRDQFLELARACDVVVDSFSPRVMPNFGLGPRVLAAAPGQPTVVSMPAFPPGPRREWVSYGTGVHALHGLGDRDGRPGTVPGQEAEEAEGLSPSLSEPFYAPSVTYPDPVSGFTTAFAILAAVVGRDRGRPVGRVEVPLFTAIQPLLAFPAKGPAGASAADVETVGGVLFDAGMAAGAFTSLPVAGMQLMHPRSPFLL